MTAAGSHARLGNTRKVLTRLRSLLDARPDLERRYKAAKIVIHAFRRPAFYEITQRCNLWCEGCYYFAVDTPDRVPEERRIGAWEDFFAAEAERHVSMAYFVGAEPALHQERLLAASRFFPHGNIGTNGVIRIDPAVPYRIGVSVWAGDDASDRKLRGGSAFRKAFKNYAGDPRAIVLFTLTRWNLHTVRTIAEMSREHALPLTFNMYSPTATFLGKLRDGSENDDAFFRVSRPGDSPLFSDADLIEIRHLVSDLMQDFPDTVVYSDAYNTWTTRPGSLYEIDAETGVATHCGSRMIGPMQYYGPDLKQKYPKCGTPDVDCSQCRMYSGGWSSKFQPSENDVASESGFLEWLDMIEVLGKIFLYDATRHMRSEIAGNVVDHSSVFHESSMS
jgi:hypothetical protein